MENKRKYDMMDDESLHGQQQNTDYEQQKATGNDWVDASELPTDDGNKAKYATRHDDWDMRYHAHSNHSSANDQPTTDTDTTQGMDRDL